MGDDFRFAYSFARGIGTDAQRVDDLHQLRIGTDGEGSRRLADHGVASGASRVLFHRLEEHLCDFLAGAELVGGCVAWLTHPGILEALSATGGVAIVVQKEDFLRPDGPPRLGWKEVLRAHYASLPAGPGRLSYGDALISTLSFGFDPTIAPVRCVGNHNRARDQAFPRMHHKFAIVCRVWEETTAEGFVVGVVEPLRVWTGSFNWTKHAARSFENALITEDPVLVRA